MRALPKDSKKKTAKTREQEKRTIARSEILANQSEPHYTVQNSRGDLVDTVNVHPVSSYSTKFMSTDDQFTLAVDKITFPEIKSAFLPQDPETSHYENPDAPVCDYASVFSLNDGDKNALACLLQNFRDGSHKQFVMGEKTRMLVYMSEGTRQRIQFNFDMYNGPHFSGDEGVPSITASFVLSTADGGSKYTAKPVWSYILTIHQPEPKLPKDVVMKAEYATFQDIMRAVVASLGILPSKLDLSTVPVEEGKPTEFMDVGTAISSGKAPQQ